MTSAEIRQQFLDFFVQAHGHTFVPSSSVVPWDDPTLMFANAGMNQFKPIFLGQEKRSYTRAANTQKCIRAGGKHNDLDDVGRSRRHATFFEMLGNWSFGDYFKRGAIEMAWELLTKVWKLDPSRLHVTCYEGDEKNGVPRDTEAADLWKQIAGLPDDHIHYFGKDNFWEMGDTGPCGPCTEIYIDRTPDKTGGKSVNGDDPRVMEFWNLVFIQYNRDAAGKLTPLPARHVDTGMGFERICSILQDKDNIYGIDLFDPFFDAISKLSGFKYTGKFPKTNAPDPAAEAADEQLRHDIAFRVIADHIRCLTFALTDGAVPSNEGRGYVLRRILRRAVRFGRQQLGLTEPFLHELVPVVVDSMGAAFPELKKNPQHVIELIKDEEVSFSKTLDRGIELHNLAMSDAGDRLVQRARLEPEIKTALEKGGVLQPSRIGEGSRFVPQVTWSHLPSFARPIISGDDAFRLHDTYGFPIDLTRIMAEERGLDVDIERYEQLMAEARVRSRSTSDEVTVRDEIISITTRRKFAPSEFVGYDTLVANAHLLECFEHTTALISKNFEDLAVGDKAVLVFDISPFYAESGGQIGDKGTIRSSRGTNFLVEETFKIGSTHFHYGHVQNRSENVSKSIDQANANFALEVSREYRLPTMKNHTGTHLANWALRQTLGDGVQQKGSLVDPEKLRFDFSHSKSLTDDELARVETLVNEAIAKKLPVYAQEAPQEAALKINGLRAVFGEKYPPLVRVVSIGAPVEQLLSDPNNPKWREFSVEFCGGTHLPSSDQIGNFSITAEESVSKGIRRIVALTGEAAAAVESAATRVEGLISRQIPDAELASVIAELQTSLASPLPLRAKRRAQATLTELQSRQRTLEKAARAQPGGGGVDAVKIAGELLAKADSLGSGKLIIGQIAGASDDQLRSAIDSLRKKSPSHAILLASSDDQKVTFVAAVSDDLVAKGLKAGDWIKQTAVIAGGGGGGRPQMAQGSGKDPSKITAALDAARNFALKFA